MGVFEVLLVLLLLGVLGCCLYIIIESTYKSTSTCTLTGGTFSAKTGMTTSPQNISLTLNADATNTMTAVVDTVTYTGGNWVSEWGNVLLSYPPTLITALGSTFALGSFGCVMSLTQFTVPYSVDQGKTLQKLTFTQASTTQRRR